MAKLGGKGGEAVPELEYLMTYRADLEEPVDIGAVPSGTRQIFDVKGGSFEGPRLKGRLLPSGADWLLIGTDGVGRLDVRGTLETEDGAHIYLQYFGVIVIDDKVMRAMTQGEQTQYGDIFFMTQPRFETGHPSYNWLNSVVAVAQGRVLPNAVEYRVYQVVNT
jgi:hypothetical protein